MLTLGRRPLGLIALTIGLLLATTGAAPDVGAAQVPAVVAQRGDHSVTVKAIQRALIAAGITPAGGADGWYGAGTTAAVAEYQRRMGLTPTGIADRATATLLGVVPATPLLAVGSRGAAVVAVQQQLMGVGISLRGGADGVYGSHTAAAVKYFQQTRRVRPTGALDAGTGALLAAAAKAAAAIAAGTPTTAPTTPASTAPTTTTTTPPTTATLPPVTAPTVTTPPTAPTVTTTPPSTSPATTQPATTTPATTPPAQAPATLAPGSRGPAVVALQRSLIAVGLQPRGGADGIYGASTTAMVRSFQSRVGVSATGIADAQTQTALSTALSAATAALPPAVAAPSAGASPAKAGRHGLVDLQYLPVPRTCVIRSSFGAPRSGGRSHQGMDIMVARVTPIYASRAGTITEIDGTAPAPRSAPAPVAVSGGRRRAASAIRASAVLIGSPSITAG